jgi:hypothetical protein
VPAASAAEQELVRDRLDLGGSLDEPASALRGCEAAHHLSFPLALQLPRFPCPTHRTGAAAGLVSFATRAVRDRPGPRFLGDKESSGVPGASAAPGSTASRLCARPGLRLAGVAGATTGGSLAFASGAAGFRAAAAGRSTTVLPTSSASSRSPLFSPSLWRKPEI